MNSIAQNLIWSIIYLKYYEFNSSKFDLIDYVSKYYEFNSSNFDLIIYQKFIISFMENKIFEYLRTQISHI